MYNTNNMSLENVLFYYEYKFYLIYECLHRSRIKNLPLYAVTLDTYGP